MHFYAVHEPLFQSCHPRLCLLAPASSSHLKNPINQGLCIRLIRLVINFTVVNQIQLQSLQDVHDLHSRYTSCTHSLHLSLRPNGPLLPRCMGSSLPTEPLHRFLRLPSSRPNLSYRALQSQLSLFSL